MKKIVFLGLAVALTITGCSMSNPKTAVEIIGLEEAKAKTADFINNNLMQPGSPEVSIKEIVEENELYKVVVNTANGQEITSYLTKDGKKFFPQVMDIAEYEKETQEKLAKEAAAQTQSLSDIPKKEKSEVELFVMAFCPYGVQAVDIMGPVANLLGDKADIKVRYIASVSGGSLDNVKSLHGVIEGKEDARQLCVAKNYDNETFWKYVLDINKNCYSIYSKGEDGYNACWKEAASGAGISTSKIDKCMASEGVTLIQAEDEAAKNYGVTGSPSLIINGVKYNGARNAEAFKEAICAGFDTPPEECSQALDSEAQAANGGC